MCQTDANPDKITDLLRTAAGGNLRAATTLGDEGSNGEIELIACWCHRERLEAMVLVKAAAALSSLRSVVQNVKRQRRHQIRT